MKKESYKLIEALNESMKIKDKKSLKEWDSSIILDSIFAASEVIGEDPDWKDVVEEIINIMTEQQFNQFLKDNNVSVESFWENLYGADIDSVISNLESYLNPNQIEKITAKYNEIANKESNEDSKENNITKYVLVNKDKSKSINYFSKIDWREHFIDLSPYKEDIKIFPNRKAVEKVLAKIAEYFGEKESESFEIKEYNDTMGI